MAKLCRVCWHTQASDLCRRQRLLAQGCSCGRLAVCTLPVDSSSDRSSRASDWYLALDQKASAIILSLTTTDRTRSGPSDTLAYLFFVDSQRRPSARLHASLAIECIAMLGYLSLARHPSCRTGTLALPMSVGAALYSMQSAHTSCVQDTDVGVSFLSRVSLTTKGEDCRRRLLSCAHMHIHNSIRHLILISDDC